jgi:hypothetical protein
VILLVIFGFFFGMSSKRRGAKKKDQNPSARSTSSEPSNVVDSEPYLSDDNQAEVSASHGDESLPSDPVATLNDSDSLEDFSGSTLTVHGFRNRWSSLFDGQLDALTKDSIRNIVNPRLLAQEASTYAQLFASRSLRIALLIAQFGSIAQIPGKFQYLLEESVPLISSESDEFFRPANRDIPGEGSRRRVSGVAPPLEKRNGHAGVVEGMTGLTSAVIQNEGAKRLGEASTPSALQSPPTPGSRPLTSESQLSSSSSTRGSMKTLGARVQFPTWNFQSAVSFDSFMFDLRVYADATDTPVQMFLLQLKNNLKGEGGGYGYSFG